MTDTKRPNWRLLANLGDVHPLDYGGYFIFEDVTGVYAPEAELLTVLNEHETDEEKLEYEVHRFILEPCTYENGILSDNKYHKDHEAWFANDLQRIAESVSMTKDELIAQLTGNDIIERAHAYYSIGGYHGFDNFDSYPLTMKRGEATERYSAEKYQTEK